MMMENKCDFFGGVGGWGGVGVCVQGLRRSDELRLRKINNNNSLRSKTFSAPPQVKRSKWSPDSISARKENKGGSTRIT